MCQCLSEERCALRHDTEASIEDAGQTVAEARDRRHVDRGTLQSLTHRTSSIYERNAWHHRSLEMQGLDAGTP
jgi:hypothetical protein